MLKVQKVLETHRNLERIQKKAHTARVLAVVGDTTPDMGEIDAGS